MRHTNDLSERLLDAADEALANDDLMRHAHLVLASARVREAAMDALDLLTRESEPMQEAAWAA